MSSVYNIILSSLFSSRIIGQKRERRSDNNTETRSNNTGNCNSVFLFNYSVILLLIIVTILISRTVEVSAFLFRNYCTPHSSPIRRIVLDRTRRSIVSSQVGGFSSSSSCSYYRSSKNSLNDRKINNNNKHQLFFSSYISTGSIRSTTTFHSLYSSKASNNNDSIDNKNDKSSNEDNDKESVSTPKSRKIKKIVKKRKRKVVKEMKTETGGTRKSSRKRQKVSYTDQPEEQEEEQEEEKIAVASSKKTKTNGKATKKKKTSTSSSKVKGATTTAAASPKKAKSAPSSPAKTKSPKKKSPAKKRSATTKASSSESENESPKKAAKKKKAPAHQVLTDRDELPRLWNDEMAQKNGSYTFRIASWNVAGLRAILKNHPDALPNLVKKHNLDMLCLQETKLQESHLDDPKLGYIRDTILSEEGYDSYYSCSTAKKGYSGTAIFVKKRSQYSDSEKEQQPKKKQKDITSFFGAAKSKSKVKGGNSKNNKKKENENDKDDKETTTSSPSSSPTPFYKYLVPTNVSYKMNIDKHDQEGRLIVLEMPLFTICNVYVPNAGQGLVRLDYRVNEWDKDFVQFILDTSTNNNKKPIMWVGDLNIAHTNLEVWNDGAKHLPKQAGVTPEERASFTEQLSNSKFVDAFRYLHPTAKGHYSYWSQRAGNRTPNKGLRLDYFICDPNMISTNDGKEQEQEQKVTVRDSYMIYDQMGSDHCPVVLELEIKP